MNDLLVKNGTPSTPVFLAEPAPFEFDGHRFSPLWGPQAVQFLDLAYRARRGDAPAARLLNGFRVKIVDADGRQYWPDAPEAAGADLRGIKES